MSTLNHEVWANSTTPLFLRVGQPNASPSVVINSTSNASMTTSATTTSGNIWYGVASNTEAQAYGELSFSNAGGWALKTNNVTQLAGTSGAVTARDPITITSEQNNNTLLITNNSVGRSDTTSLANEITFLDDGINIGNQVIIQSGQGLEVQSSNGVNVTRYADDGLEIIVNTTGTSTTTQTFSSASIPAPPGFTTQFEYQGIVFSSDSPTGDPQGGLTLLFPSSGSSKALTTNGTFPASGKGAWTQSTAYTSYIEFPTIASTPGTPVSVAWKQAGIYNYGVLYKNDVPLIYLTSLTNAPGDLHWITIDTATTSPALTFTSTGEDRLYILVQNQVSALYPYNTPLNIGDISITTTSTTPVTKGFLGYITPSFEMVNATSGSLISIKDSGEVIMTDPTQGSKVQILSGNINLSNGNTTANIVVGSNISVNSPTGNISNVASNLVQLNAPNITLSNSTAQFQITPGNIFLTATTGATINTTLFMSDNNIDGVTDLTTERINAVGTTLGIGAVTCNVNLYNVASLTGTPAGLSLSNVSNVNASPACPNATLMYTANFTGFKGLGLCIPPAITTTSIANNIVFGNGFTGDSFVSAQGFTIPANCTLTYSNLGSGITTTLNNPNPNPSYIANTGFSPSSTTQFYSLKPNLSTPSPP